MPDPKKKKNAPANAATDTNTNGAQKMYKKRTPRTETIGTAKATPRTETIGTAKATPIQRTSTSGGRAGNNPGQISNRRIATPLQKSAVQGAMTGGAGQMTRQSTPRRTHDPFLAGFNSDIDGIKERPAGRKRRK